jgi:DNA-binding HxlR family transcriptional regulator
MYTKEYNAASCPVGKTIDLISGKWKPIILYLVQHGVNRFSLLQKRMPKISKKVLTGQLRDLEVRGLINRHVIVSKHPQEVVYSLTESGGSLRILIDQIFNWGTENLVDEYNRGLIKQCIIAPATTN